MSEYWLLLALVVKHFICDYPLQMFPWQYRNKGIYGHEGGIVHALIHVAGTMIVLFPVHIPHHWFVLAPIIDGIIHYHVDWAKVNFCARYNLLPTNSDWYWFVLGLDQLLHYLTYFAIVYMVTA